MKKWKRTKMNLRRARWALAAVAAMGLETRQDPEVELEEMVGDLLGNLQHLCARKGIDFNEALAVGTRHFELEAQGIEF